MVEIYIENILNLRVEKGLTLTKLAEVLNIDRSSLSNTENQNQHISERFYLSWLKYSIWTSKTEKRVFV